MAVLIQALILGIVQGLTEYLPVSSSAHLIIFPWLFGWNDPILTSLTFDVALHLGTLVAVIWFFAKDLIILLKALITSINEHKIGQDNNRKIAWYLLIATIPGAIAGMFGESKIEKLFHQENLSIQPSAIIALALIIGLMGLLLLIADRVAKHHKNLRGLNIKESIIIGFSQALAIFPGVSRSGATITTGLWLGLKRSEAAKFSFLLGAPIIAGAGLKSILEIIKLFKQGQLNNNELILFPIGFLTATFSGYLCIKYLMKYLENNSLKIFVYYRLLLAIFLILIVFLGIR